uniref:Uncharacterized protein n=1 Tax=Triticum urartu TaxID=4572 RepID=A0A8R7V5Z8_TRIUA
MIPCPRCLREVVSDITVSGKRPGNCYYWCVLWTSRQCEFFEWQENYHLILRSGRSRSLAPPPSSSVHGLQHRPARMDVI